MNTKNEIRNAIRLKRAALTLHDIDVWSRQAIDRLNEVPAIMQAKRMACYLAKPFEVQTQRFIETCLTSGKSVCVPRRGDDENGYAWSWVEPAGAWRDGPWRIPEPAHFKPVDNDVLDVVIVPAVALDPAGHRLGHGGGNFDRLLGGLHCTRVGLVFDFQLIDEVPIEAHDTPVEIVVTESRTITPAS